MEFVELPEFARELKRLAKKYRSLPDDLDVLKKTLQVPEMHVRIRGGGKHWVCVHRSEKVCVYKIRLACRYLRSTELRLVYARHLQEPRTVFLELYYKGDKENEDRERIRDYISIAENPTPGSGANS